MKMRQMAYTGAAWALISGILRLSPLREHPCKPFPNIFLHCPEAAELFSLPELTANDPYLRC
jgi:hypothetical protein